MGDGQRLHPTGVPLDEDPDQVLVSTPDNRSITLPRATAERMGVVVADPEVPAAIARPEFSTPGPAPTFEGAGPVLNLPQAGPQAAVQPAPQIQGEGPVIDPFSAPPSRAPRPGETFAAPAAPQRRDPRVAPLGTEVVPVETFESEDPVARELRTRPEGAPALVPRDQRGLTSLEQEEQRIDRDRQRAQEAAENAQAAAIDREDILRREQDQRQAIQAERDAALAGAQRRFFDVYQEARSATVNPSRLWQNGGGIAMTLGAVFGQLGQALAGGENTALQIIDRAVERDIRAQVANQRNARANVRDARSFFSMARERFGDQESAAAAARALAWDQIAQRTERQTASLTSAAARDDAARLVQEARTRARAALQEAMLQAQERELATRRQTAEIRKLEAEATRAERRAGGGGGGPRRVTRNALQTYDDLIGRGVRPEEAAQRAGLPRGFTPGQAEEGQLSGEERGQVASLDAALSEVERIVQGVGRDGDIPGFGVFDSVLPDFLVGEEGRELRQAVTGLNEAFGRLHSGGAISDDEFELFNRIIGSRTFDTEAALRRGLQRVRREINARRGRAGNQPSGTEAPTRAPLPPGVTPRGG